MRVPPSLTRATPSSQPLAPPAVPSFALVRWRRRTALTFGMLLVSLIFTVASSRFTNAQSNAVAGATSYPSPEYYLGLKLMRAGAMREANQAFNAAVRRARKTPRGRWIDAIPAHAMMGETLYQLGNLPAARQQWEAALTLAIEHEASLTALQWPVQFAPRTAPRASLPAWAQRSGTRVSEPPERVIVMLGEADPERRLRTGGTFVPRQNIRVDAVEIVRTLGWACYRRAEVLGPLAEKDPLFAGVKTTASRLTRGATPAAANLWSTVHGIADLAASPQQAANNLLGRTAGAGGVDHPLTPLAGLVSARWQRDAGQWDAMQQTLLRILPTAEHYDAQEAIAEAMRLGAGSLAVSSNCPLCASALMVAESGSQESALAFVSANLLIAEAALTQGDLTTASTRLALGKRSLAKRETSLPRHAAWSTWIGAGLSASRGQTAAALTAMGEMAEFVVAANAGPAQYQRGLLLSQIGGDATQQAETLLRELLREPTTADWARDPIDAAAHYYSPNTAIWEALLEAAVVRGDADEVLSTLDARLATSFRSQLPFGGRLLDLQWWLTGPEANLPDEQAALRRDLQNRFPNLAPTLNAVEPLVTRCAQLNLTSDDKSEQLQNGELARELNNAITTANQQISAIAFRRAAFSKAFPAPASESFSAALSDDTQMLVFHALGPRWYGFWIDQQQTRVWEIEGGSRNGPRLKKWLSSIGVGRRRAGQAQLPTEDDWKDEAVAIRDLLIPPAIWNDTDLDALQTLTIVPTGMLWQFPIAALPADDRDSPPLLETLQINHAPTPTLAVAPPASTKTGDIRGYLGGRFFAPRDTDLEQAELDGIVDALDSPANLQAATSPFPGNLQRFRLQTLWIADALRTPRDALQLPLIAAAENNRRKSPPATLSDWITPPIAAPETVLLPGLRSDLAGDGSDLFTIAMGLKAAGVEQALLARWAVGGPSTATLLRETLKELPNTPLTVAWQRAVQVLATQQLDPELEPLLSAGDRKQANLTGEQPLFWAGYLLLR